MSDLTASITAIALAIVGVATLSVIVSRNSNTSGVLQAAGSAFSTSLGAAMAPVTGANSSSSVANFGNLGGALFPIG